MSLRGLFLFSLMAAALVAVGMFQSWDLSVRILNMCLISAVMALGVNMQWGYAGLFNVGTMGFAALGGLAVGLVSMPPITEAWRAGGAGLGLSVLLLGAIIGALWLIGRVPGRWLRGLLRVLVLVAGFYGLSEVFVPATAAIEAVDPALSGYVGGLGLPVLLSWPVGGLFAAAAAWGIGRIALGLRADYLAIATLGISEIVIAVLKNEDWLARGVKNLTGLPKAVPQEVDIIDGPLVAQFIELTGLDPATAASVLSKLFFTALVLVVLLILLWLSETALRAPWGRMMRAIRDNRDAAEAMGKNVTRRHLQVFILGSAICGIAGAMMVTMDGQFTPTSYIPLRYTFLIWVMVILGGSGNNYGAILGGFVIWFAWVEAEPFGIWAIGALAEVLPVSDAARSGLTDNAAHMRLVAMGAILLLVMRFAPRGLLPERSR